jgi:hypothetical protein
MRIRAVTVIVALLVVGVFGASAARRLPGPPKPRAVRFTIVAEIPQAAQTSFGSNEHVFVVELIDAQPGARLAKVSYRYLSYEQDFPAELMRPDLVQRFVVTREHYCDADVETVTTRIIWNERGEAQQASAVHYLSDTHRPLLPSDLSLPCYVSGPHDYRGSYKLH